MAKSTSKDTFEKKLKRLEEISSLLESENLGLDKAIKLYQEGIELSGVCLNTLKNAELKITELKKKVEKISPKEENLFEE